MHELDTVYSVQDVWEMLEIRRIDRHNSAILSKAS